MAEKPKSGVTRKRTVLSIETKLEICKRLKKGATVTAVSREFYLEKSTISDIKRNEGKLTSYAAEMESTAGFFSRKTIKKAKYSKLDDSLYLWFAQKRSQGIPISGPILMAKALELNQMMNQDQQFKIAQDGLKTSSKAWNSSACYSG